LSRPSPTDEPPDDPPAPATPPGVTSAALATPPAPPAQTRSNRHVRIAWAIPCSDLIPIGDGTLTFQGARIDSVVDGLPVDLQFDVGLRLGGRQDESRSDTSSWWRSRCIERLANAGSPTTLT
jgi:hypothetical protein